MLFITINYIFKKYNYINILMAILKTIDKFFAMITAVGIIGYKFLLRKM
jgi:hypothetical protein